MLKIIINLFIVFFLIACSHQNKSNQKKVALQNTRNSMLISEDPIHSINSSNKKNQTLENKSQTVIENLLDADEAESEEVIGQDSSHQVESSEATYNEQDKAEDVIGKLLEEGENESSKDIDKNQFVEIKNHPLVNKWITFFTQTDRARFIRFMTNGAKYRSAIEKIFEDEGVPKELFFVGMVESGFFLKAKSFANAVGPWQFVRGTAKRYGLIVSRTLDERKDLYKSTRAAARYFRDLYKIFGSWELAMSAYNSGEYGMMRRMKKANSENFFNLATRGYLHPETVNYVPKVMAMMHIYQNLDRYNFVLSDIDNPFDQTVLIKLKHSHSLRLIANTLDIDLEDLSFYNSELPTPYTPYLNKKYYELRVPKSAWLNNGAKLMAVLRQSNSRTPPSTLANYEKDHHLLSGKKRLKFVKTNQKNVIKTNQPLYYTVQAGDNVTDIAKFFKTSASQISKINRLSKNQVMKGQKIRIPQKVRTYYQVKRGDNLHSIAKKFNLTASFLKQLNDLDAESIYAGQKILILL